MPKTKSNDTLVREAAIKAELAELNKCLTETNLFVDLPLFIEGKRKNGAKTFARADITTVLKFITSAVGVANFYAWQDDSKTIEDCKAVKRAILLLAEMVNLLRPNFDEYVETNKNVDKMGVGRIRGKSEVVEVAMSDEDRVKAVFAKFNLNV